MIRTKPIRKANFTLKDKQKKNKTKLALFHQKQNQFASKENILPTQKNMIDLNKKIKKIVNPNLALKLQQWKQFQTDLFQDNQIFEGQIFEFLVQAKLDNDAQSQEQIIELGKKKMQEYLRQGIELNSKKQITFQNESKLFVLSSIDNQKHCPKQLFSCSQESQKNKIKQVSIRTNTFDKLRSNSIQIFQEVANPFLKNNLNKQKASSIYELQSQMNDFQNNLQQKKQHKKSLSIFDFVSLLPEQQTIKNCR